MPMETPGSSASTSRDARAKRLCGCAGEQPKRAADIGPNLVDRAALVEVGAGPLAAAEVAGVVEVGIFVAAERSSGSERVVVPNPLASRLASLRVIGMSSEPQQSPVQCLHSSIIRVTVPCASTLTCSESTVLGSLARSSLVASTPSCSSRTLRGLRSSKGPIGGRGRAMDYTRISGDSPNKRSISAWRRPSTARWLM